MIERNKKDKQISPLNICILQDICQAYDQGGQVNSKLLSTKWGRTERCIIYHIKELKELELIQIEKEGWLIKTFTPTEKAQKIVNG